MDSTVGPEHIVVRLSWSPVIISDQLSLLCITCRQIRCIPDICHFVDTSTIFSWHQKHTKSRSFDTKKTQNCRCLHQFTIFWHQTGILDTCTACGACDKYQVWSGGLKSNFYFGNGYLDNGGIIYHPVSFTGHFFASHYTNSTLCNGKHHCIELHCIGSLHCFTKLIFSATWESALILWHYPDDQECLLKPQMR